MCSPNVRLRPIQRVARDPIAGEARNFNGEPEQVKSISKVIDNDHYVVEAYRVYPDGKEAKHLTLEYTRRK